MMGRGMISKPTRRLRAPRHRIQPFAAVAALAAAACTGDSQPAADSQPTLALTGATVWDGTGAPARVADILIVDGRIAEVGSPSIPSHATVLDYSGKWIIPGLVEAPPSPPTPPSWTTRGNGSSRDWWRPTPT